MKHYIKRNGQQFDLTDNEIRTIVELELGELFQFKLTTYLDEVFAVYGEDYHEYNPITKRYENRNRFVKTAKRISEDPEEAYKFALTYEDEIKNFVSDKGHYFAIIEKALEPFVLEEDEKNYSNFKIVRDNKEITLTHEEMAQAYKTLVVSKGRDRLEEYLYTGNPENEYGKLFVERVKSVIESDEKTFAFEDAMLAKTKN